MQLSKGIVSKYVSAASRKGLDWPALPVLDVASLAANLTRSERRGPDVIAVHRELQCKAVTLQLLWEEYVAAEPAVLEKESPNTEQHAYWRSQRQLYFVSGSHRPWANYLKHDGQSASSRCQRNGLSVTAATNVLEHQADITHAQHWLGNASISTTRLYDRRQNRAGDSPSFKIQYEL